MNFSKKDVLELKEKHDAFIELIDKNFEKEIEYNGMKIALVSIQTLAYTQKEYIDKLLWAFEKLEKGEYNE